MPHIDPITEHILREGYIVSDKTISVDLHKFESGKSNKLLIVGLIASGKSTLGWHLSKKYKVPWKSTDECESFASKTKGLDAFVECTRDMVKDKNRGIVEGIALVDLYTDSNQGGFGYKKELQSYPMIIIGRSVLSASVKAFERNYKQWLRQTKINMTMGQKRIDMVRKHRASIPGAVVKDYVVPKL